jgi:hypothetical protein
MGATKVGFQGTNGQKLGFEGPMDKSWVLRDQWTKVGFWGTNGQKLGFEGPMDKSFFKSQTTSQPAS